MITLRRVDYEPLIFDATRVSTDEHNNLEIWAGDEGEQLLYVCAAAQWVDVTIGEDTDGE